MADLAIKGTVSFPTVMKHSGFMYEQLGQIYGFQNQLSVQAIRQQVENATQQLFTMATNSVSPTLGQNPANSQPAAPEQNTGNTQRPA